jgi:predicted DNA binding CopG/RHH family protein
MSYVRDMPRKDTRITIRVHEEDLIYIQNQAIETGIPYQTLISALLHQYAKGKIVLSA